MKELFDSICTVFSTTLVTPVFTASLPSFYQEVGSNASGDVS